MALSCAMHHCMALAVYMGCLTLVVPGHSVALHDERSLYLTWAIQGGGIIGPEQVEKICC